MSIPPRAMDTLIEAQAFEIFDNLLTSMAAAGLSPLKASSHPDHAHFRGRDVLIDITQGRLQLPVITRDQAEQLATVHPFTADEIFRGFCA